MSHHSPTTFFQRLAAFDHFFEPAHREIVQWLNLARGARIADIGCGAGGMAVLFAEQVGDSGNVAAVEVNAERVTALRAFLETSSLSARISSHQGELPALSFAENEFDVVWCSRVIHHVADPVAGIRELARIAKKGGRVILREGGITPRFLPYDVGIGAAGIEERVRVAHNAWFDNMRAGHENSVRYPRGWLAALRDAGLQNARAKSFLYELTPPFTDTQISYLRTWLNDFATNEELELSEADRDALRQLTDPASEHDAFRRDDLHLLYVASVYVGEK